LASQQELCNNKKEAQYVPLLETYGRLAPTDVAYEPNNLTRVIGQNVEVFAVFCVEVFTLELGLRKQPQFDCTSTAPRVSFGVRRTCLGAA
jgi:hypothetical protein